MDANIAADLKPLAVPLKRLKPLKGNARKGDVDAVARSYETFGQRKPLVVRRTGVDAKGQPTGEILAGNHQYQAAKRLGWPEIAVVWVDDDDTTGKAYALADNRVAELGGYDEKALAALLADVANSPLFEATGYDASFLDDLPEPEPAPAPKGGVLGDPVIATNLVFDTEDQQKVWYGYVRWLRTAYPDCQTNAERIVAHLRATVDGLT